MRLRKKWTKMASMMGYFFSDYSTFDCPSPSTPKNSMIKLLACVSLKTLGSSVDLKMNSKLGLLMISSTFLM